MSCTVWEPFAASITSSDLMRRRPSSDGFARAGVLRAVDGVGPLDQFGQVGRLVVPALARHGGDEPGAGTEGRVVQFPAAGVAPVMFLVFGR